jgi:putative transposase
MTRKKHLIQSEYPYHVTARTHAGSVFRTSLPLTWEIMSDYLYLISHQFNLQVHAFVLMSNHFHLLVTTPDANLSAAMNYFMRETSKEINRFSGCENQNYGNRYFRCMIADPFYFDHVYKYVYRNPVEAGVVEKCEQYRFSTLHSLLGQSHTIIPMKFDPMLFELSNSPLKTLAWLNTSPQRSNLDCLNYRLTKQKLKFPLNRKNKSRHYLESGIY